MCIVSGCFLSLGLKFAGSSNKAAFELMFPWISRVKNIMTSSLAETVGSVAWDGP